MKICIPSHRRAATISTHRLVPDAIVCVPESQRTDYEKAGCVHVHTHPDSIRGLTPKLNWMLENLVGDEDAVFLDDDLEYLCRCFVDRGEQERRKVTEAGLIFEILQETAAVARELGAFFFGWESSESTIRYYSGLDPFKFTGFVNGCAMGFIAGHGLRFDESIVAKNDYDARAEIKSRVVDNALVVFYEGRRARRDIPDFALDRHTGRGRRKSRGWDHFFTEGVGPSISPDNYLHRARHIRRDNRLELEQT